jgi:hypothetical protein
MALYDRIVLKDNMLRKHQVMSEEYMILQEDERFLNVDKFLANI